MKNLPLGINSLSMLRESDCIYPPFRYENLLYMRLLDEQYTEDPTWGVLRMTAHLRRQGYPVNIQTVDEQGLGLDVKGADRTQAFTIGTQADFVIAYITQADQAHGMGKGLLCAGDKAAPQPVKQGQKIVIAQGIDFIQQQHNRFRISQAPLLQITQ